MIEAIKVIVSLVLAITLLCGVVGILMNFPFIILAVALLALLGFFVWGLTNFFLIGGKNESFCKYSFYNWCISRYSQSFGRLRRLGGDYLYVSFLEVNMFDILLFIFGLLMAGCGVAMIIALAILMAFLIKSFKEDW